MEEFNLDDNQTFGTLINNNINHDSLSKTISKNHDSDIDYDNIIDNLNISDTNMNIFTKNVEDDIKQKYIKNDPMPINMTKDMLEILKSKNKIENVETNNNELINKIKNYKYKDIIFYLFVFILLNSKLFINSINNRLLFINNNELINLFIRSLIFGLIFYLISRNKFKIY